MSSQTHKSEVGRYMYNNKHIHLNHIAKIKAVPVHINFKNIHYDT